MALNVGNLMSQHAGYFVGAFRPFYKPAVHVDSSTGDGKSIELRIFDHKEAVIKGLRAHGRENPLPDTIHIPFHLGIVDELKLLLGLTTKLATDSYFVVLGGRT